MEVKIADIIPVADNSSGNIAVTGGAGGPYTVRFMGTLDGLHEGPITATSSLTGGSSPGVTAVTLVPGGNSGMQETEVDPRGIVSKTDFDLLGRTLETVAAFTDGVPSNADDQTTAYTYDGNGDVLTQTAVMPIGAFNQTTAYIYGVGVTVYDYTLGVWDQKDPGTYVNGMNVYEALGGNPIGHIDPSGMDFIAIGDNKAAWYFGFHYSVTLWSYCKQGPTSEVDVSKWTSGDGKGARQIASIELWKEPYWYEWVPTRIQWKFWTTSWELVNVDVSVIHTVTGDDYAAQPQNILAIADDMVGYDTPQLKSLWERLKGLASEYPYAEQLGTRYAKRWPNSAYDPLGNNSNSFAKWLVQGAGIRWQPLSGPHPGNDLPSPLSDGILSSADNQTTGHGEVPSRNNRIPMPSRAP